MDKRIGVFILLISTFGTALAGFDDFGSGVRASGMADAFVALADDASAINHNPAGLAQINTLEFTTQSGQLLKGLSDGSNITDNYAGYIQPLKSGQHGTLGLGYQTFNGANFYKDRMLYLSYGANLNRGFFGSNGQWSSGITMKQFHRDYQPNLYTSNAINDSGAGSGSPDPLFLKNGFTKDAYSVDLGALYRLSDNRTSVGAMVMNINRPDISVGGNGENAPLITKLGLARHSTWGTISTELSRTNRLSSSADTDLAVGAERTLTFGNMYSLGLRAGYGQGSRGYKTLCTGMSFQISNLQFDYSFDFPMGNLSETSGNHRIALTLKFNTLAPAGQLSKGQTPEVELASVKVSDDYSSAVINYMNRKAAGASEQERISLLQDLYTRFGEGKVDLSWLSREFSSL